MDYFLIVTRLTCQDTVVAGAKHATAKADNLTISYKEKWQLEEKYSILMATDRHSTAAPMFSTRTTPRKGTEKRGISTESDASHRI